MNLSIKTIQPRYRQTSKTGFTIVELMIAMTVLSVLLLLASVTLINIGRLYSKGSNEADTQNTARNIINQVASEIQFGGSAPLPSSPTAGAYCIGSQRYTYQLGQQLAGSVRHVLWQDTTNSSGSCNPLDLNATTPSDISTVPNSGSELVPANMRLTDFSITNGTTAATYTVKVTVVYGADDLVNQSTSPATCHGGNGTEFCAVSSLSETVTQRIQE